MQLDLLTALNTERAARRAAVVVTNVATGKQRLVKAVDAADDALQSVLAEHLRSGESGKPKVLEFGVADETAWKVGLSCGGRIRVLVEKVE